MTREYTRKLLEMIDEGMFDPTDIATMALNALDESEVEQMCRDNDLIEVMGLDDEEDELDFDDEDGQPDEAQEWADYDANC